MVINLLMVLSLLVAVVAWLKVDRAVVECDCWDCRDVVRHAEARRRFRRWRVIAGVSTVAYVVFWYWGA